MFGLASVSKCRLIAVVILAMPLMGCASTTIGARQPLFSSPVHASNMAYGHPVEPPAGYLSLCIRSPVDCAQTNTVEAHQQMVRSAREAAQLQWRRRIDEVLRRTVTQEPQARETRVSTPGASVALMDTVAGPAGGQVRDQAHFQAPSPAPIPTAVDDRVDIVQDEIASRTSSERARALRPWL